jgi:hypothetical protein
MTRRDAGTRALLAWALVAWVVGCGQSGAAADAGTSDGPTVQEGRIAVTVRRCDQCHQSPNPADGVLSGQTTPVPGTTQSYGSNLTPDPDTGMDGWDAGTIAGSLLVGTDDQGRALCPSMPRWADAGMSQDEASSIALYLQSLTPVWHRVPPSRCPLTTLADGGP